MVPLILGNPLFREITIWDVRHLLPSAISVLAHQRGGVLAHSAALDRVLDPLES